MELVALVAMPNMYQVILENLTGWPHVWIKSHCSLERPKWATLFCFFNWPFHVIFTACIVLLDVIGKHSGHHWGLSVLAEGPKDSDSLRLRTQVGATRFKGCANKYRDGEGGTSLGKKLQTKTHLVERWPLIVLFFQFISKKMTYYYYHYT